MGIRKVNRNQRAQYAGGSKAKGWYVFSLQGVERNGVSIQYFSIESERKSSQDEAKQSAWQAAREWVAEKGEVVKTDSAYTSEF